LKAVQVLPTGFLLERCKTSGAGATFYGLWTGQMIYFFCTGGTVIQL